MRNREFLVIRHGYPEGSTIAFERARAAWLRSKAESDIDEVQDASHRWCNGDFGTCEKYGRAIPTERLTALRIMRTVPCALGFGDTNGARL